jgi:hypothetical protein
VGNFLKAVFFGMIMMVVLFCFAHHWVGFDISIDDEIIEPILGLGAVMMAFIISMVVVGLVIAGVIGSVLLFGTVFVFLFGGIILFSGFMISWPVIIVAAILYLMVRDNPKKRARMRY